MSVQFDFRHYRRVFLQPLRTARGEWAVREGFILRRAGPAGVSYAEVAPIPEFGSESVTAAGAFLNRLLDDPALRPGPELPCCAFAVSAASDQSALPTRSVPLSGLLPAGEAALDRLPHKLRAGFGCFKWKVGVEPADREQELFALLCEQLPVGARIRLDANASWQQDTLRSWTDFLTGYQEYVDYIEQPLPVGQEGDGEVMNHSGWQLRWMVVAGPVAGWRTRAWCGPW